MSTSSGGAPRKHQAQIAICHERIASTRRVHESREDPPTQFCNLRDVVWCWTCAMYVCQIHAISRHDDHEVGD